MQVMCCRIIRQDKDILSISRFEFLHRLLEAHGIRMLPEDDLNLSQSLSLTEAGKLVLSSLSPRPTALSSLSPRPTALNTPKPAAVQLVKQPPTVTTFHRPVTISR